MRLEALFVGSEDLVRVDELAALPADILEKLTAAVLLISDRRPTVVFSDWAPPLHLFSGVSDRVVVTVFQVTEFGRTTSLALLIVGRESPGYCRYRISEIFLRPSLEAIRENVRRESEEDGQITDPEHRQQ